MVGFGLFLLVDLVGGFLMLCCCLFLDRFGLILWVWLMTEIFRLWVLARVLWDGVGYCIGGDGWVVWFIAMRGVF